MFKSLTYLITNLLVTYSSMELKTSSKIILALMVAFLIAFVYFASAAADDRAYLSWTIITFGSMLSLLFGFIFNEIG